MTNHDLWTDPAIPGRAFRFAEMAMEQADLFPDFDDAPDLAWLSGAPDGATATSPLKGGPLGIRSVPKADRLAEVYALTARTRALWPADIGRDGVGPTLTGRAALLLRADLNLAGQVMGDPTVGEIVVTFRDNQPTVAANTWRGTVLLELNRAVADGWLLRRCSWCAGLFPARRQTRGAEGFCSLRCRGLNSRA